MTLRKKTIESVEIAGRRAFVRVDFNVPMSDGGIGDDTRIKAALPTLRRILEGGGSAVVASHLGRPKGQPDEALRMAPVAKRLQALLPDTKVRHVPDVAGDQAQAAAQGLPRGELLLLENLRFHPGETANSPQLAQDLAAMAHYFVQDAFGTCHRAHASTAGVPAILHPAVAGELLASEIRAFGMVFDRPERPLVAIIGGAKVSDKIQVLENLVERVDQILIGGGMAYTFLKAQGIGIGESLVEDDRLATARDVLMAAEDNGQKVGLPTDHVVADRFAADAATQVTGPLVPEGWIGLDIGPETRAAFAKVVGGAGTVVWNGPMGVFEMEPFREGTASVARALAESKCRSVIGGGDSVAAIHLIGAAKDITHLSTGGGAFLEMLEGRDLPGITALDDA